MSIISVVKWIQRIEKQKTHKFATDRFFAFYAHSLSSYLTHIFLLNSDKQSAIPKAGLQVGGKQSREKNATDGQTSQLGKFESMADDDIHLTTTDIQVEVQDTWCVWKCTDNKSVLNQAC